MFECLEELNLKLFYSFDVVLEEEESVVCPHLSELLYSI